MGWRVAAQAFVRERAAREPRARARTRGVAGSWPWSRRCPARPPRPQVVAAAASAHATGADREKMRTTRPPWPVSGHVIHRASRRVGETTRARTGKCESVPHDFNVHGT